MNEPKVTAKAQPRVPRKVSKTLYKGQKEKLSKLCNIGDEQIDNCNRLNEVARKFKNNFPECSDQNEVDEVISNSEELADEFKREQVQYQQELKSSDTIIPA